MRSPGWLLSFVITAASATALSAQSVTEFRRSEGSRPARISAGGDGNLWFVEYGAQSRIGRITTVGTAIDFPIDGHALGVPWDIAWADRNIWFTETEESPGGGITRMSPSGAVTRFPIGPYLPYAIAADLEGDIWFTLGTEAPDSGAIGRFTAAGTLLTFSIPSGDVSLHLTLGQDENLWFTQPRANSIGRITPAGIITEFSVPTAGSSPEGISAGSDGNVWFTERDSNRIGRITPGGVVTEFPVPAAGIEIMAGPDGALWFTQSAARLGRITTSGVVSEIPIPAPAFDLAAGPDGNIWFTAASSVWRLTLPRAPTIDSRILPVVGSAPGVHGSFFRTSVQLHNSTGEPMTGRIVFHPSGVSGNESDPALFYALSPGQTQSIADLLPVMGRSGLGSADIEVTSGSVPTTNARVFNDANLEGTMGFTEEPTRSDDALRPGQPGALLLPSDLTNFRFNVGVRTLRDGATVTLTLRDAAGALVATNSRVFPATYHEQQSATAFLGTSTLPAGGSISIDVASGAGFFYGAAVDNTTGDPSLQVARIAP